MSAEKPTEISSPAGFQFAAEFFRGALLQARRYVAHAVRCATRMPTEDTPDLIPPCNCGLARLSEVFEKARTVVVKKPDEKAAEPSLRLVKLSCGEPWIYRRRELSNAESARHIFNRAGELVGSTTDPDAARRIVACVNAMAGIPTEALEQLPGDVETFVAALKAGRNGGREGTH